MNRPRAILQVVVGAACLAALAMAGVCGGGCSNGRTADDLYGEDPRRTPARFSVSVTVMGSGSSDRALQPARYIVEADGTLRAGVGAGVSPTDYPPIVRRLDDRQFASLWALVDRSRILEDPDPARVSSPDLISARQGETIAVVWARAGRRTRAGRFEFVPRDPEAGRAEPIVRELARLAFVDR